MTPAVIANWTKVFGKPKDWDEEKLGRCVDLHVRIKPEQRTCESAWRPSAEELAALNAGGVVVLSVVGGQPPVMLSVEREAAPPEAKAEWDHYNGSGVNT